MMGLFVLYYTTNKNINNNNSNNNNNNNNNNTCVLLQAHTDERPRRVPDFEAQDIAALGYEVCVCFSLSSF